MITCENLSIVLPKKVTCESVREKFPNIEKASAYTELRKGSVHVYIRAHRFIPMNGKPKKVKTGLREIAAAANVSVATVSRVLNGSNRVDPAIRKSVMATAAKLNVDLSQRNKTKALAFLLSNRAMLHAFHSRVLHGAEVCCAAHGWDMVFLSFNYSANAPWNELHLPKVVQRRDVVRAVILAGTNTTNLIELLDHKEIPYVVLGNNVIGEPLDSKNDVIFSDETQGGNDMTRYLIGLGHRQIGFVGNLRLPWFARCFAGYNRAMEEAGLTPVQISIDSEDEADIGYLGAKSLLARGESVTAIFAGNDQTAHGVYKALRDSGLRIPDDISVAGCDDTIGGWLYPGLTTIREFPEQLGKQMVEMILNRIAKPDLEPQRVTIPTEFIKRDSCRAISLAPDPVSEGQLKNVTIG
jgi:DNA-binding LacI/PurR family transcriptional regulator